MLPTRLRYNGDGIAPCWDNSLRAQYKYNLEEPSGELEQLVYKCDNQDVPDYDFRTCDHNTYMCCWTENNDQGMQDNTVRLFLIAASLAPPASLACRRIIWLDMVPVLVVLSVSCLVFLGFAST